MGELARSTDPWSSAAISPRWLATPTLFVLLIEDDLRKLDDNAQRELDGSAAKLGVVPIAPIGAVVGESCRHFTALQNSSNSLRRLSKDGSCERTLLRDVSSYELRPRTVTNASPLALVVACRSWKVNLACGTLLVHWQPGYRRVRIVPCTGAHWSYVSATGPRSAPKEDLCRAIVAMPDGGIRMEMTKAFSMVSLRFFWEVG